MGTVARYWLQGAVQRISGVTFPYGTLAVNVLGSFLAGFLATLMIERFAASPLWRSALLVGFCGGFTTFSAVTYESFELARMTSTNPKLCGGEVVGDVRRGSEKTIRWANEPKRAKRA
jgi:protein CrcB